MNNLPNQKIVEQIISQYLESNSVLPLITENRIVICTDLTYNFDDMSNAPSEIEIKIISDGKVEKIRYYRKDVE